MASQILKNLWLGDFEASQDKAFLQKNKIALIVNCSKDLPFIENYNAAFYRVPVDDNLQKVEIDRMTLLMPGALKEIYYAIAANKKVLVHCRAGMQRSAIIVLTFLFLYSEYQGNEKKCFDYLRARRPIVFFPMMNFRKSFEAYKL